MIRLQQTGNALGSDILLTVIVNNQAKANDMFTLLWSQINSFEQQFSRFIDGNELSQFNAHSGDLNEVEPAFFKLLEVSKEYLQKTDGLFSPFVLPVLQREGYTGSWPTPEVFNSSLDYRDRTKTTGAEDLEISDGKAKIPFDTAIEFGGIGKGYLLDQLADLLETQHVKDYWLSLGGDIICNGFNLERAEWKVGVAKSDEETKSAGHILNKTGKRLAIATSGITKRKGQDWNHIIDPRTGRSSQTDTLTATVALPSATAADVYAKCLVILGSKQSADFAKTHDIDSYLCQIWDNKKISITKFGTELWA